MKPIMFPQSNKTLGPPKHMTDDECSSLPVFTDYKLCISCWELSDEDIADLVKTRKIWLWVFSGGNQPPVALDTKPPRFT